MLEKTRCVVLRMVRYGDQNLIVDLLTREWGRQSVVWRAPKAGKGRIRRQYFQPLTILDIDFERKSSSKLPLLKEARIAEPFLTLQVDPVKLSVSFFIAEFLCMATKSAPQDSIFYDFVERSLVWYDTSDGAPANFHLMFMMRVSKFLGFYPNIEDYEEGSLFDLRAGLFTPYVPLHKDFLRADDAKVVVTLLKMSPANMHLFRFSRAQRNNIIEVLLRFYSLHIPDFRPLKSWEVLKEVFS